MEQEAISFFKRMGDLSDPWNNRKLNGHGITLWYGIQNFVDQLDSPTDLEDVARKFAVTHIAREVGAIEFGVSLPVCKTTYQYLPFVRKYKITNKQNCKNYGCSVEEEKTFFTSSEEVNARHLTFCVIF